MPKKASRSIPHGEDPLVTAAWNFRGQNLDLPLGPSGMMIWFAPDGTGNISMTITVPEGLTWAKYRRAWPTVNAWRERLTELTGRRRYSSHEKLYRHLVAQKQTMSYSKLADYMNGRIEKVLSNMLGGHRRKDKNQILFSALVLRHHLSALHVKPGDLDYDDDENKLNWKVIEQWSLDCCKRMALGKPAFAGHPPITRTHIIARLRPYLRS